MSKYKALTIYEYYDGATLFTARGQRGDRNGVYLFRWEASGNEEDDLADKRIYKADGFDITVTEAEVDWSEAEA